MNAILDCGSHCEMYGVPPDKRAGEWETVPFCDGSVASIEQPLGRGKKATCPPSVAGDALITTMLWIVPMFFRVPVSAAVPCIQTTMLTRISRCGTTSPSMRRLPQEIGSTV